MEQGYALIGGVYNKPVQDIKKGENGVIDIGKYAWEASGWFWNIGNPEGINLNTYADKQQWDKVSTAINANDTSTFPSRKADINAVYTVLRR